MNFIELTSLIAVICNLALTLYVLKIDRRATINRVYFFWGCSVTLWNIGVFLISRVHNASDAFTCAKVLQLGVIFLPICNLHMCLLMARMTIGYWLHFFYLLHFGFALSLFTGHFITGVRHLSYSYYSVAGPGFWLFALVYSVMTATALILVYRRQQTASPVSRIRLKWMLIATSLLALCGTNDLLPILGVCYYPFTRIEIHPIACIGAISYVVMVGYSVMQHQLLDIHVTMSRFAAQIVRLFFMLLIGTAMLLTFAWLAPQQFTTFSFFAALGVLLAAALAASFLFPRFFGQGSDTLERHFLGDRFEYHARVHNLIQRMRSFPEPDILVEELENLLGTVMKVGTYHIILLDETTRGFVLFHSMPARPQIPLPELQLDSPLFRFFQETRSKYLACDTNHETAFETALGRNARLQAKPFAASFCFPFVVGNELVGLLLLGAKTNQDPFTPHDLHLLSDLSDNLGLVLNQIRLRNQLQQAHEQDLLGRMSRGLAHDLNNLLTPVHTLLQLLQETELDKETINELLPMALHNLSTVRVYVNEALFFSRTASLKARSESLLDTIRNAIATVQRTSSSKEIKIIFNAEEDIIIEMDSVLIQRLICNLLSNAIDASPSGSEIQIKISLLPRTELSRDWYRVRIEDHGEGISPENLKRVSTPYFTTKDTGDGKRGFGLGLAIARKIVHLHGGNLSIASKEKIGTTVQVDLPSRLTTLTQAPQKPAIEKPQFETVTA